MIKYHNALDSFGNIISIDNVKSESRASIQFTCISCGTEMVACLGKIKQHYFRHKKDCECSPETYFHRLGKLVLKKRFDSQPQFLVKYKAQNYCQNFPECELKDRYKWKDCSLEIIKTINLKEYYDTCEVEASYKGFRADLMLTHSEYSDRKPVFLEISVTHDCEQNKIDSGIRIIEIKVETEIDVFRELIENPTTRFYSFKRINEISHSLSHFYLYRGDNGIYNGKCESNAVTCRDVDSKQNEKACFEVTISEDNIPQKNYENLYALGIALSHKEGFEIKNCILCAHYGGCNLIGNFWVNKSSSQERSLVRGRVANKALSASEHDKSSQAQSCSKYHFYEYSRQKIIDSFKNIPYDYNQKE